MRDLFFYGTLRDVSLLEIVMGNGVDALRLTPTTLPDYLVSAVAQGPFPMIAAAPGETADGLLVEGLSDAQIARIDFYEGSFAYDLVDVTLSQGQRAEVYLPQPGLWTPTTRWSLSDWQAEWGELSYHAAREVMGYFEQKTKDQVAAMFPRIRARAASKVRASQSLHGVGTLDGSAEITSQSRAYGNFFALDDLTLTHSQFDGSTSDEIARAVFIGTDAAVVLPYDPVRDRVLLVEQIRMGPLARGDRSIWQLEAIAGLIDAGETPESTALREAEEEAGVTLSNLESIAQVYASPGNSTEFYYIYLGLTDLPDDLVGIGGLDSEHEDIRSHLMSFDALMAHIEKMEVTNVALVLAALWLAQHRERLRSG